MASIGNYAYVLKSKLIVKSLRKGDDPLKLAHAVRHLGDAYYYAGRSAQADLFSGVANGSARRLQQPMLQKILRLCRTSERSRLR